MIGPSPAPTPLSPCVALGSADTFRIIFLSCAQRDLSSSPSRIGDIADETAQWPDSGDNKAFAICRRNGPHCRRDALSSVTPLLAAIEDDMQRTATTRDIPAAAANGAGRTRLQKMRMFIFPGFVEEERPLTRAEFLDLLRTAFAAITFLSVVFAALTFMFQHQVVDREYEWRRKKEAQDVLKEWDQRTSRQKASIESFFKRRYGTATMVAIRPDDARAIVRALSPTAADLDNDQLQFWKLRLDIVELLNYFELISTACRRGIADEPILREALGPAMISWRTHLRPFTDAMDADMERPVWEPYYSIVASWQPPPRTASAGGKRPPHGWGSLESR
jgi:hypothetical protein